MRTSITGVIVALAAAAAFSGLATATASAAGPAGQDAARRKFRPGLDR